MKKSAADWNDVLDYLQKAEKDPAERERFNRSVKRAANRERKRKDGEFSAMFLSAIRIP